MKMLTETQKNVPVLQTAGLFFNFVLLGFFFCFL